MSDKRRQALALWANSESQRLHADAPTDVELQVVSGDASFRRYFRLATADYSYIAVDAPPATEDSETFVRIAGLLRAASVSAPRVYAVDYAAGFMLLEDFGDELYLDPLLQAQARGDEVLPANLYGAAIRALVTMQDGVDCASLEPYDRHKLHAEMALFETWFCEALLELPLTSSDRKIIAAAMQLLEDVALSQPQVAVHRDYHSRNLLVLDPKRFQPEASPGIIDFQDAVAGPYTYDLVSLLRDCYIRWDEALVWQWAGDYLALAAEQKCFPTISEARFRRDFDLMGLQRHLKVMGIFSRLCIRDNKPRYLADIPLVIQYFLQVSGQYQELADFRDWFKQTVLPVARKKLNL